MPTGHEGEADLGVRIRVEIGRPQPRYARELQTDLTNRITQTFVRASNRFVPTTSSLREGLDVTITLRDFELDSGGKQPKASCRLLASAEKIQGGRVAQMNEGMRIELGKGDIEREVLQAIGEVAQDLFSRFVRECDKRY